MAKVTPIKQARRALEADVYKLICNCDPSAYHFRVTVINDQVTTECAQCLTEFGPFYLKQIVSDEPAG